MPRYFFHVRDSAYSPDTEGVDLPDLKAARQQAVLASGEILRDAATSFWTWNEPWRMCVTDAADNLLFTLTFAAREPSEPGIHLVPDRT